MDVVQNVPVVEQQQEAPITRAELTALLQTQQEASDRKLEATINRISGAERIEGKRGPGRPPSVQTTHEIAAVETLRKEIATQQINQSLNSTLDALGVENSMLPKVTAFFKANYGERINMGADGLPMFTESDVSTIPLKDYLVA